MKYSSEQLCSVELILKMSFYKEFNPYQWPPNLILADLHSRCSMPGRQNPQGEECPCCQRKQKLKTTNWFGRDITKDFKNYGGGIPGYFRLLAYYGLAVFVVLIVQCAFHIYCLEVACKEVTPKEGFCMPVLKIFKMMPVRVTMKVLQHSGHESMAKILQMTQLFTFLFLLCINFCAHYYLNSVESKIIKQAHILSKFSLFLKQIDRYDHVDSISKMMHQKALNVQIRQLFMLYKTSDCEDALNNLIDCYFRIQYFRHNNKMQDFQKQKPKYLKLYEEYRALQRKLKEPTGRAIVVFEKTEQKEYFQKEYHRNNLNKFCLNVMKLFNSKRQTEMFADKMHEPGEMIWKYVGESSVSKTKVRIETTAISLVYLGLCYGLLVFPLREIQEAKEESTGFIWNIILGTILFILSLTYRIIMSKLSIKRKPNTYLSKSKFQVFTTVMFHILFYLYIPAIYYVFSYHKPYVQALKLKTLFFQVVMFMLFSLLLHTLDLRYRFFVSTRKKYLSQVSQSHRMCQKRLHQQLTFPSFPIQFKLMILYKIWSFVAFYSFQLPYIIVLMLILMLYLYWNDKHSIYTHYKMQTFLPIELEQSFQEVYIYVFMITVCLSYMTVATKDWQFYGAIVMTGLFALLKIGLDFVEKRNKKDGDFEIDKSASLTDIIKEIEKSEMHVPNPYGDQVKLSVSSYIETTSLKSMSTLHNGYEECYVPYMQHLHSKHISDNLDSEYAYLKGNDPQAEPTPNRGRLQSQMASLPGAAPSHAQ